MLYVKTKTSAAPASRYLTGGVKREGGKLRLVRLQLLDVIGCAMQNQCFVEEADDECAVRGDRER
jgi:hypothetical protein